ncbi:DMT family transporter [Testudinibacter sp. P80/BLE/0925]|uniref:DMT family transporter n=1 Tax=Testudinibacter sp. TW-1 TaxID=3417757 RepID=UPI003D368D87
MQLIWILATVLAGAGLAVEAGLLGPLGQQVGKLWATFSIFSIGACVSFLLMLFFAPRRRPSLFAQPGWQLGGGVLGPVYVVVLTLATPVIGVAVTMIGVLMGQIAQSLINDHYALFGSKHHPLNRQRLIALGFILAALGLIAWGEL